MEFLPFRISPARSSVNCQSAFTISHGSCAPGESVALLPGMVERNRAFLVGVGVVQGHFGASGDRPVEQVGGPYHVLGNRNAAVAAEADFVSRALSEFQLLHLSGKKQRVGEINRNLNRPFGGFHQRPEREQISRPRNCDCQRVNVDADDVFEHALKARRLRAALIGPQEVRDRRTEEAA